MKVLDFPLSVTPRYVPDKKHPNQKVLVGEFSFSTSLIFLCNHCPPDGATSLEVVQSCALAEKIEKEVSQKRGFITLKEDEVTLLRSKLATVRWGEISTELAMFIITLDRAELKEK